MTIGVSKHRSSTMELSVRYRSAQPQKTKANPCRCHQKSSYRIELGVAKGFPEMGVVKRTGVVAPLPHVPAGTVHRVLGSPSLHRLNPVRAFLVTCG